MKKTLLFFLISAFTVSAQTVTDYVTSISPPSGIVFDSQGNLFIGDYLNYKIIKVDLLGNKTTITNRLEGSPNQITLDGNGNIWAPSEFFTSVAKVTQAGTITNYSAIGNAYGVAIDASGAVYFSESGPGNIKKIDFPSGTITTFKSGLKTPRGLTFDANGDLLVACGGSANKVVKISPSGTVTDLITGINSPYDLTLNTNGDLYVSTGFGGSIYLLANGGADGSQSVFSSGLGSAYGITIRNNELYVARQGSGLNKVSKISLPTLGLNDIDKQNELVVYPNPSSEFVYIKNIDLNSKKIELFGINGRLVKSYNASEIVEDKLIVSDLQTGNYILKIGNISKKIIIR
ncbi:Vgb family protein [Flavobacterium flavigenum]|uniref:Vgb family protein n=1 Tax=Flavobacterium flavigenum TaxID=3003258 RepID=UPI002482EF33|nr:T9SS type A sorting domain-containing protein [Flavobacterium flavigenum]